MEDITKYRTKKTERRRPGPASRCWSWRTRTTATSARKRRNRAPTTISAYNGISPPGDGASGGRSHTGSAGAGSLRHALSDRSVRGQPSSLTKDRSSGLQGPVTRQQPAGRRLIASGRCVSSTTRATTRASRSPTPGRGRMARTMGDSHWVSRRNSRTASIEYGESAQDLAGGHDGFRRGYQTVTAKRSKDEAVELRRQTGRCRSLTRPNRMSSKTGARHRPHGRHQNPPARPEGSGPRPSSAHAHQRLWRGQQDHRHNWDKAWDWTKACSDTSPASARGSTGSRTPAAEAGTGIKTAERRRLPPRTPSARPPPASAAGAGRSRTGSAAVCPTSAPGSKNGVSRAGNWASETPGRRPEQHHRRRIQRLELVHRDDRRGRASQARQGGPSSLISFAKEKAGSRPAPGSGTA